MACWYPDTGHENDRAPQRFCSGPLGWVEFAGVALMASMGATLWRIRWVFPALVLSAACSGCGADTEGSQPEREVENSKSPGRAESRSPTPSPSEAPAGFDLKRLATVAAAKPWGTGPEEFARSGDGATLVVLTRGWPRALTRFRIYGRSWRPITGLREAALDLHNVRGLPHGFVAEAIYARDRHGNQWAHTWVHIDRSGHITQVPRSTDAGPIAANEIVMRPDRGGVAVVNQRASYVRRPKLSHSAPRPRQWQFREWQLGGDGTSCIWRGRGARTTMAWTFDSGRTWTKARLGMVTPKGSVQRVGNCQASGGDRLLITEGDQLVEPAYISTLEVTAGANNTKSARLMLVGRYPLSGQGPIWMSHTLPDGRAVLQDRGGLQVAGDSANSWFEFRPGPVKKDDMLQVLGRDLISSPGGVARRFELDVSTDAGQTWRVVDLKAGSWN